MNAEVCSSATGVAKSHGHKLYVGPTLWVSPKWDGTLSGHQRRAGISPGLRYLARHAFSVRGKAYCPEWAAESRTHPSSEGIL